MSNSYNVKVFQKSNMEETPGFKPAKSTVIKEAVLGTDAPNKWIQVSSTGTSLNGDVISEKFLELYIEDFYTFSYGGPVYLGHIDYERRPGQPEPSAAAYVRALELTKSGELWALYEFRDATWDEVSTGGFHFNSIFGVGIYESDPEAEDDEAETLLPDPVAVTFRSIAITNTPAVDGLQSMVLSNTQANAPTTYLLLSKFDQTESNTTMALDDTKNNNDALKEEIKDEILDELKTEAAAEAVDDEGDDKEKAAAPDASDEESDSSEESDSENDSEEDKLEEADPAAELTAALIETLTQLTGAEAPLSVEEALGVALQLAQDQLAALAPSDKAAEEEEALLEEAVAATRNAEANEVLLTLKKENEELKLQLVTNTVKTDIASLGADEAALDGLLVVLQSAGQEAYDKLLATLKVADVATETEVAVATEKKEVAVVNSTTVIAPAVVSSNADDIADISEAAAQADEWMATFRKTLNG